MSLLASELQRLKYELGYPLVAVGAEPYISYVAVFDNVIQPYLSSGATTTSTTAVTVATTPTLASLTLDSATGFTAGCTMVVDVDARQERVSVESVSGSVVTALLSYAHSGTYPVTVEGGESIVRDILRNLRDVDSKIRSSASRAGIKKVDEIEFFGNSTGGSSSAMSALNAQREYWRDELSTATGVPRLRPHSAGGICESY